MESIMPKTKNQTITAKNLKMPKPPKTMTADEIISLRKNKLKVSQPVFASLLNASPAAVKTWEQGIKEPNGATLRLLQIIRKQPEILLQYLR
jgi:putative transcriptional regulator